MTLCGLLRRSGESAGSGLMQMRDEGPVKFDIYKGVWSRA